MSKEVAKELSQAFGDLKDFGESGARDVSAAINDINSFLGVVNPFLTPLKLLMAQFTSGTINSSMELSKELVELLRDETTQSGIKKTIGFINALLLGLADFVDKIDKTGDTIEGVVDHLDVLRLKIATTFINIGTDLVERLVMIRDTIVQPFETVRDVLEPILEDLKDTITRPFIIIKSTLENVARTLTNVWDKISFWN